MSARRPSTRAVLDAQRLGERLVDLGQVLRLDLLHRDHEVGFLAGHVLALVVGRELQREGLATRRPSCRAPPASNCSSIWPSPIMNWKPSALPPSNGTPSILPSKSIVTRSPSGGAVGLPARCAKVRRCLRRMSSVLSIAASVDFGRHALDLGLGQVAELDLGVDLEGGVEGHLAFRRAFLLGDRGCAGDAQLGFVGGLGEDLADLVVHDLVVHRVAVALGDHAHRHLAGAEAVGLDGARQLLQARLDFATDAAGRQRQRDAALELVEGFNVNGHDVCRGSLIDVLVRGAGLEPAHQSLASGPKPGASTNFATRAGSRRRPRRPRRRLRLARAIR